MQPSLWSRERWHGATSLAQLPAWLFAAWAITFVLRAHVPYLQNPYEHNVDEGYLLAVGQRMLQGRMLPFVDGVAHSGPLFLYSGALIAAFGEFSWVPIRVAAALSFAATSGLTFVAAQQAGYALAGAIGAAAIPLFCLLRFSPIDGVAYNAEVLVNIFVLASLACLMRATKRDRPVSAPWVAAAGVCASCAGLSKQVGALQAVVLVGALVLALYGHTALDNARRLRLLGVFALAGAVPALLVLGWFAVNGALADLYYYVVTYNRTIYMHFATESRLASLRAWSALRATEVALCTGALGAGLYRALSAPARASTLRDGVAQAVFPLSVTALAAAGLVGARASMRDFDHYYVLAIPWFGLLAGLVLDRGSQAGDARWRVAAQAALLLPLVLFFETSWSEKRPHLHGWAGQRMGVAPLAEHDQDPIVCERVREHSNEGDTMFVWGFRPELYVSCGRRPASRFVFTTFVAGYVPWNWAMTKEQEDELTVPGSRALLLAELETTKPPVIVDSPKTMSNRSMTRYDELGAYLATHYRLLEVIDGDGIYLRNEPPPPNAVRRP